MLFSYDLIFSLYLAQACFEGNPFKTVPGPFKLFWQCMRSKPGYVDVNLSCVNSGKSLSNFFSEKINKNFIFIFLIQFKNTIIAILIVYIVTPITSS